MTAALATKESNPVGRPTKYHEDMIERVEAMPPSTFTKIAVELGVNKTTLYEWIKAYPAFSNAVNHCRALLVNRYEDAMLGQVEGTVAGNATAGIFMLKNLAPDEYRDRREHQVEVTDHVELNFLGFDDDAIDGDFEEIED